MESPVLLDAGAGEEESADAGLGETFLTASSDRRNEPLLMHALARVIRLASRGDRAASRVAKAGLDRFISGLVEPSALVCIDEVISIMSGCSTEVERLLCIELVKKLLDILAGRAPDCFPELLPVCVAATRRRRDKSAEAAKDMIGGLGRHLRDTSFKQHGLVLLEHYADRAPSERVHETLALASLSDPPDAGDLGVLMPFLIAGLRSRDPAAFVLICQRLFTAPSIPCLQSSCTSLVESLRVAEGTTAEEGVRRGCREVRRCLADALSSRSADPDCGLPIGTPSPVADHCRKLMRRGSSRDDLSVMLP